MDTAPKFSGLEIVGGLGGASSFWGGGEEQVFAGRFRADFKNPLALVNGRFGCSTPLPAVPGSTVTTINHLPVA